VFGVEGDLEVTAWFGTVRGRADYANILFYGNGGLAFGELRGETFGLCGSHTSAGWTLGAGAEFGVAPNWTAKIEYLFVDLSESPVCDYGGVERQ
jgi:outer membrane immunogenic protein